MAIMEPLVLEECGALLLRGNDDAEVMLSSPAVSTAEAKSVSLSSLAPFASALHILWRIAACLSGIT